MTTPPAALYLGIDFGTSGVRAIAIDSQEQIAAEARAPLPAPIRTGRGAEQAPAHWWQALSEVLDAVAAQIDLQRISRLAVDGTSGTLLVADQHGTPLGPALMYNDGRSLAEAKRIAAVAPQHSAAHGATSALAKLLHLNPGQEARYALHQADWIVGKLTGHFGISDENNCLKLGYDPSDKHWPAWLDKLGIRRQLLPRVVTPGTPIGPLTTSIQQRFGFSPKAQLVAGTTDSTAAFMATGASQVGEAVTSLGSTLVMKVIADRPIFSPRHGVYAQPLGEKWLVGGGSNSGGAVLLQHFSKAQMAQMTPELNPHRPTGLDFYPLNTPGERFPVSDPQLPPRLSPKPEQDLVFFQAMLEGMAHIELQGYRLLAQLGAPYPDSVRSAGGGSHNPAWTTIRQRLLAVPFVSSAQQEAAYGSALLAKRSCLDL